MVPGNTYYIRANVPASATACTATACPGSAVVSFTLCIQDIDIFQPLDFNLLNFGFDETPAKSHAYYTNKGQIVDTDGNIRRDIKLYTQSANPNVFVFDDKLSYVFTRIDDDTTTVDTIHRLDMNLVGANPNSRVFKADKTGGHFNYYLGHIPSGITKMHGYSRLVCNNVYPNVDMQLSSNAIGIKQYFIIRPGGNADDVVMEFTGANSVSVTQNGGLKVVTDLGELEFEPGHAYCINPNGNVVPMPWQAKFEKVGSSTNKVKFDVRQYPAFMPLVIQVDRGHKQKLTASGRWITYFGGDNRDEGNDLTIDDQGNVYLTGQTGSSPFPVTTGAHDEVLSGIADAFLVKFDIDYELLWGTYFGGDEDDIGYSIDWTDDALGKVYMCGKTRSTKVSFPFIDLLGTSYQESSVSQSAGGGFIARFNDDDGIPDWSTFFSPAYTDARSIKVDAFGNVYMSGHRMNLTPGNNTTCNGPASNGGLPMCNPGSNAYFQNFNGGGSFSADIFLVKFNNMAQIEWSTFFGGDGNDWFSSIALDELNGFLYLTGVTRSDNHSTPTCQARTDFSFPLCNSGGGFFIDKRNNGAGTLEEDAFIAKFNLTNMELVWSTYFGGSANDAGSDVAVNSLGDVYMAGRTRSSQEGFPTCQAPNNTGFPICKQGYFQDHNGGYDAFIARFNINNDLVWSTWVGGDSDEEFMGNLVSTPRIAIRSDNDLVFILGSTRSYNDMPIAPQNSAYNQASSFDAGSSKLITDAYVAAFSEFSNNLEYGTYFGGSGGDVSSTPADGDIGNAIATYQGDRLYIAGFTYSLNNFPFEDPGTTNAYLQPTCSDCNNTSDAFIAQLLSGQVTTAIPDQDSLILNGAVSIYPNPSKSNVTIELNTVDLDEDLTMRVYNVLGKLITTTQLASGGNITPEYTLDVQDYADGVYLLVFSSPSWQASYKLVKQ